MNRSDRVRYPFRMSPGRISVVYELGQRYCMARIGCRRCEHLVVISATIMERLFGRLERLDNTEKRGSS
jgi:hypothetical protein